MKVTPHELREYISFMRTKQLQLKHDIEVCEFDIQMNRCPGCNVRLRDMLECMREDDEDSEDLTETLGRLEEFLAEDEAENGWKGDDRVIEL